MANRTGKRAGVKLSVVLLSVFLFLLLFSPVAFAATYGDINNDGVINVQDVVLVMKHALDLEELTATQQAVADVNGDGNINVQDVTLIMQYSLGLIDEFPHAALAVSKVTAVNPKQVEVEFNRMLNAEEKAKMTTANFHVGLQAAPLVDRLTGTGSAVAVKEDGKTVLLTIGDTYFFVNGSSTNRAVVKQAVGLSADYVVTNLAFVDTSVPTLVSVETISPRRIVMTFSEPLNNTIIPTNITLNGGAVALNLAGATYVDARRELIVDAFSDLPAGTHTLAILSGTSLKDYSGFSVVPTSKTFTHTPITTAPTVSVKSATENTVTLEFSRAINSATLIGNTNVLFRHTWNTALNQVTGTSVTNPSSDSRTFVVNFGTKLLPPGSTTVWMKYADGTLDANKVKDTWGNIIPPATLTANVVPDTVAPTATVTVFSNTQIDVQYSKEVTGATTIGNYSLKKGANTVTITGITSLGGNKYRLTVGTAMQGAYILTISNIKDTSPAENAMGVKVYNLDVTDVIAPFVVNLAGTAQNVFYWQADLNKVRIFFSEPMNPTDLANKSMFENRTGATTYVAATVATPGADGKSVYLEFASNVTVAADRGIRIGSVRDLAGNSLGIATQLTMGVQFELGLDPAVTPAENRLVATTTTTVKAYLSDIVTSANVNDFEIRTNTATVPETWVKPSAITIDNSTGKSVLTFTLAGANALNSNALDGAGEDTQLRTVSALNTPGPATNTKNAFGIPVEIAATKITDKIPPVLVSAKVTSAATIELTFSEKLSPATFTATSNGFSVTGGAYTLDTVALQAGPNDHKVVITKTGAGDAFVTGTSRVSYNSVFGHKDLAGNLLTGFTNVVTVP